MLFVRDHGLLVGLNEDQHALQRPARRVLVDRSNPLNYFDEIAFRDRFRMFKENALEIIYLFEPRLSSVSRGRPFSQFSPSSDLFEVLGIWNLSS